MEFTERAKRVMEAYPWPGNIRQLYNCLVHASIHSSHNTIDIDELPSEMLEHDNIYKKSGVLSEASNLSEYISFREEEFLRHMLEKNKGNVTYGQGSEHFAGDSVQQAEKVRHCLSN